MSWYDRRHVVREARKILSLGGWCAYETSAPSPSRRTEAWEMRSVLFDITPHAAADSIEAEIALEPGLDARITGWSRTTLQPDPSLGAFVCYLADRPVPDAR